MIDEQITVRGRLLRASSKIAIVPSMLTALMRGGLSVSTIKPETPPAWRIRSSDGSAQSAAKASGAPRSIARYSSQYPLASPACRSAPTIRHPCTRARFAKLLPMNPLHPVIRIVVIDPRSAAAWSDPREALHLGARAIQRGDFGIGE